MLNASDANTLYRSTPSRICCTASSCFAIHNPKRNSMLLKSATTNENPLGAMIALRSVEPLGKFCGLVPNPDHLCVTFAPEYVNEKGYAPRSAISANASVLDSRMVDLFSSRVATIVAIIESEPPPSIRLVNSSSVFANAQVSLPVVRLILVGGATPYSVSSSANLSLLIRCFFNPTSLLTPSALINVSNDPRLAARISDKSVTSNFWSSINTGRAYIRIVRSITRSSALGKVFIIR